MIVDQRLQQGGRFFAQIVVVSRLRTENSGFQSSLIEQSVLAAVFLDLVMVNRDDFRHGQVDAFGRSLSQLLINSRYFSLERR